MVKSLLLSSVALVAFAGAGTHPFSTTLTTIPKPLSPPFPVHLLEPEGPIEAFAPGEFLTYDIDYGPIPAGTASLAVHELSDGTWRLEATGKSRRFYDWIFPVRDSYVSVFDPTSQLPVRFLRDVSEGGYELHQDYAFDWSAGWCETEEHRRRTPDDDDAFALPGRVQDMVSAFYTLRNLDLSTAEPGDIFTLPTIVDGELFPLSVTFLGRDQVRLSDQTHSALAFQPVIQEGRIWSSRDDLTVWVSDDRAHVPLVAETRLLIGSLRLTLTSRVR